jgi:hypothetical protein
VCLGVEFALDAAAPVPRLGSSLTSLAVMPPVGTVGITLYGMTKHPADWVEKRDDRGLLATQESTAAKARSKGAPLVRLVHLLVRGSYPLTMTTGDLNHMRLLPTSNHVEVICRWWLGPFCIEKPHMVWYPLHNVWDEVFRDAAPIFIAVIIIPPLGNKSL